MIFVDINCEFIYKIIKQLNYLEFHGDFWHGNPNNYDPSETHPITNKAYGEMFKSTLHKEMDLRSKGYKYLCIWESDFNNSIEYKTSLEIIRLREECKKIQKKLDVLKELCIEYGIMTE